jgi:lipopolysaccharide transport system permease protein
MPLPPAVTIRPTRAWVALDWRSLVAYRDLIGLLVQRDFTARYKQTVLGPLWYIVSPFLTTIVFTVVFSRIMGVSTDGTPPMLFYLCGMLGWSYFSNVLGATANSLAGNAGLFSKVYFPRLVPPLAATLSNLLALGVQLLTFLAFYGQQLLAAAPGDVATPSWRWLLFPLLAAHMACLGLGVGLILSALTAKYRDLQHVQGFLVQLWMYATPVIYPYSRIPADWRWLADLNPMTAVVEATRWMFLGTGAVPAATLAVSLTLTAGLLTAGLFVYQSAARTFVDTV